MAILHNDADPPTVGIARIISTIIPRIINAGLALALALKARETAAELRFGAVADVGVLLVREAWACALLTEGAGIMGVVETAGELACAWTFVWLRGVAADVWCGTHADFWFLAWCYLADVAWSVALWG